MTDDKETPKKTVPVGKTGKRERNGMRVRTGTSSIRRFGKNYLQENTAISRTEPINFLEDDSGILSDQKQSGTMYAVADNFGWEARAVFIQRMMPVGAHLFTPRPFWKDIDFPRWASLYFFLPGGIFGAAWFNRKMLESWAPAALAFQTIALYGGYPMLMESVMEAEKACAYLIDHAFPRHRVDSVRLRAEYARTSLKAGMLFTLDKKKPVRFRAYLSDFRKAFPEQMHPDAAKKKGGVRLGDEE